MDSSISIIIPARLRSTRLPNKMLLDVHGLPLIVRTAKQAMRAGFPVLVAYDDEALRKILDDHQIPSIATQPSHDNGTERLAEVVITKRFDDEAIVVNVQGDEPLLPPELIQQVVHTLQANPNAAMATLACPCMNPDSPNVVKVVCNQAGEALYFSRAPIPVVRDGGAFPYLRHLGIYAYRAKTLKRYTQLSPTPLEQAEKLEQLRFLEHGLTIAVGQVQSAPPHGVDTHEDWLSICNYLSDLK
ncbi:MAG: 3-deoxy-manno-octulosonate cytidylyltransferase [Cardiobacteriaceae bacterium]|nr:3-deoxy-manno-octulosonate cytidylyltransferase [Cardiobacteriaceae bacterium]